MLKKEFYLYPMKRFLLFSVFLLSAISLIAQNEDVSKLHENAKTFMRQGDYANASIILARALQQEPDNIGVAKDLAFDYYLQKENSKALEVIKPFLESKTSDDQSFQIAGIIYKANGDEKEAEKIYKKGIKNFPESGPLYNDYGELLWTRLNPEAIKLWEKGIQKDPNYPNNYYNACKYYYLTKDKIWSLLYGEIFINMEYNTARTAEIKNVLLDGYKKLYADIDLMTDTKDKNKFELAYLSTMNKQNSVVKNGINPESLAMIRTRFILDWSQENKSKFPFQLFSFQQQLMEQGIFPVYNQWIFGAAQNLSAYQNWINAHPTEYTAFSKYRQDHQFKVPANEFYH